MVTIKTGSLALNDQITYASPEPKTSTTHSHPVTARVSVTGDLLRASAETTLRQSDFGIKLVNVAGGCCR